MQGILTTPTPQHRPQPRRLGKTQQSLRKWLQQQYRQNQSQPQPHHRQGLQQTQVMRRTKTSLSQKRIQQGNSSRSAFKSRSHTSLFERAKQTHKGQTYLPQRRSPHLPRDHSNYTTIQHYSAAPYLGPSRTQPQSSHTALPFPQHIIKRLAYSQPKHQQTAEAPLQPNPSVVLRRSVNRTKLKTEGEVLRVSITEQVRNPPKKWRKYVPLRKEVEEGSAREKEVATARKNSSIHIATPEREERQKEERGSPVEGFRWDEYTPSIQAEQKTQKIPVEDTPLFPSHPPTPSLPVPESPLKSSFYFNKGPATLLIDSVEQVTATQRQPTFRPNHTTNSPQPSKPKGKKTLKCRKQYTDEGKEEEVELVSVSLDILKDSAIKASKGLPPQDQGKKVAAQFNQPEQKSSELEFSKDKQPRARDGQLQPERKQSEPSSSKARPASTQSGIPQPKKVPPLKTIPGKTIARPPSPPSFSQPVSLPAPSSSISPQRLKELLPKVTHLRGLLDFFGEQATFFSKNSSSMKVKPETKDFLRVGALPWHYPIFLFFKYMFLLSELFRKFYHLCSRHMAISGKQLREIDQDGKVWRETLPRIEKALRKNDKVTEQEEVYVSEMECLVDLQDDQRMVRVVGVVVGGEEREQDYAFTIFLRNMRQLIYSSVTKLIKSLALAKILSASTAASVTLREGAYRILNSTIILQQMHSGGAALKYCESMEGLSKPTSGEFKGLYEVCIKDVLGKREGE